MGLERIGPNRMASWLIPKVARQAQLIPRQVVTPLVDCEAVKQDDVTAGVVSTDPSGSRFDLNASTAGPNRLDRIEQPGTMRSSCHSQTA